jgi:hypothetical protein
MNYEAVYEDDLDYLVTDLLDEGDTEFAEEAETSRGISCVTPGNPYVLHCFPAFKSKLLNVHREHLERIVKQIEQSNQGSSPITRVKIVGHAATWNGKPKLTRRDYIAHACKRAQNTLSYLNKRLLDVGLSEKVKVTIDHRANDEPLQGIKNFPTRSDKTARDNRALNRRVELFLIPSKKKKKKPKNNRHRRNVIRVTKRCCKIEHRDTLNLHIRRAVKASRLAEKRLRELSSMLEAEREESWNKGPEKLWFGSYKRGRRKTPFEYVKRNIVQIRRIFLSKNPNLTIQCYYTNDAPDIPTEQCSDCKNGLDCKVDPFDSQAATFGFSCICTKRNYLNPMRNLPEHPPFRIYLTNLWFYRPKGLPLAVWKQHRSTTIIHELAHLAGATRLFDEQIGAKAAIRLARRNAWGARVNADNYANYVMSWLNNKTKKLGTS